MREEEDSGEEGLKASEISVISDMDMVVIWIW